MFYQKIELWRIYLLRSLVLWLVLPISIPCYLQYLIILDCLLKYKANIISGNLCLRHFVYFISPFKFLILICPKLLLSFHLRDISFYLFIPRTTGIFYICRRFQTLMRKMPSDTRECLSNLFSWEIRVSKP